MLNGSIIIVICWCIFLFYWGISWRKVKPSQETMWRSPRFRWKNLAAFLLLLLLMRLLLPHGILNIFFSPQSYIPQIKPVGIVLIIVGLIIAIIARKTLADNWSSNVELKKEHKLITTGIYKYMRHPIYTGIILMGIGTALVMQSIITMGFYVWIIGFLFFKLKKEEKLLLKYFPKDYPDYMKRTKALFPFIY